MTVPTMTDHHANAVRYPACNCGAVWKQRGNITGHCTRCHETFDGISLFDRHQHTGPDGHTICTDPADITLGKAERHLEYVDGTWRGPRMPADVIAARFGTRDATEPRSNLRHTPEQGQNASTEGQGTSDPAGGRTAEGAQ